MRLVRIVVVLLVGCCVFYLATPTVAQFLLLPVAEFLPADENGQVMLNVLGAFDAFAVRFQLALWSAAVATAPFILWQILAFFLPALKPKERKWFLPTFIVGCLLFILGTVFCYLVILNPAFEWLTDQASGFATVLPEASKWIDIIIKFEIGFGLGFELPLVVFYLVMFDIVPYDKLRKSWRYIYVGLLIFSAMVTPDASPVTMGLMFAALILLYEISLLVARIALRKRSKAKEEQLAQEAKEAQEAREEMRQLKKDFDQHLWGSEEEQKKQAEELALQKAKRDQAAANQASKSEVQ
jgi:sec-independent protein translocase protein TatC